MSCHLSKSKDPDSHCYDSAFRGITPTARLAACCAETAKFGLALCSSWYSTLFHYIN